MIDSIARALRPQKASLEPQKAVTGPGAAVMSWGIPISNVIQSSHKAMLDAQAVYARGNRWVKRAEMVISARVGGVPWHLETDDGDTVDDDASPELKAIRDLFEQPLPDYTYPSQPKTRRELWGLTSRHMGLCNVGFWYLDEIDRAMGWPKRIFFIRPDRMEPQESGGRLTGWWLDKTAEGGGTSLSIEEVLPFYLDPPDKGFFGTGLVESIFTTTALPNAIDRHAIDTLSSGGRLPGLYAPKEAATDDVFDRMMSDLRTIKDMPDSSKRDLVARAPIEFTPTAADMSSLVVTALASMSRDDTLAHWGVPLSTIGGYTPAGMNSGETRKYDEAALWQNAVAFRIAGLYETIQYRLLDRLKAGGIDLSLVIEEPTFDDDAPKYEIAAKALNLPLRNVERRAQLGLDPFGDPALDNAVWMPLNIVTAATAPDAAPQKASLDKEVTVIKDATTTRLTKELRAVLTGIGRDIAARVRSHHDAIARKPGDTDVWMPKSKREQWAKDLQRVLNPQLTLAVDSASKKVERHLGKTGKADLLSSAIMRRLMASVGKRIGGILDTTRDTVRRVIEDGLKEGLGAAELGDRIEQAAAFDEYRAELIARTETAHVLNEAALESYREFGVETVRAIDGDNDDECAARDGQEYPLDEALAIEDHPNGTLDWVPVLSPAKAAPPPPADDVRELLAAVLARLDQKATTSADVTWGIPQITIPQTINVPPAEVYVQAADAPVINYTPPEVVVNVPETVVNVPPAEVVVNLPEPAEKASIDRIQDVRVVEMPARHLTAVKKVNRTNGLITEVREESVEEDG